MDEMIILSVAAGNWVVADMFKVVFPSIILIWFLIFQDSCSTFFHLFRVGLFFIQAIHNAFSFAVSQNRSHGFVPGKKAISDDSACSEDENEKLFEECAAKMMERLMIFGEVKEEEKKLQALHLFDESEPSFEEIKEAFDVFDENGDGFIDENEVERILCRMGFSEFSQKDCREMIRVYDENKDGRIDFLEFLKLMEHSFG